MIRRHRPSRGAWVALIPAALVTIGIVFLLLQGVFP